MGVNDVPGDSGKHYVMGVDLTAPFLARALAYSAGSAPARGKRKGEREVGISLAASKIERRLAAPAPIPEVPKSHPHFVITSAAAAGVTSPMGRARAGGRGRRVMPSSGDRAGRNDDEKEEDDERKSLMTRSFFDDRPPRPPRAAERRRR